MTETAPLQRAFETPAHVCYVDFHKQRTGARQANPRNEPFAIAEPKPQASEGEARCPAPLGPQEGDGGGCTPVSPRGVLPPPSQVPEVPPTPGP